MNVKIIAIVALVLSIIAIGSITTMVTSVDEYGYITLGKGGKPGKPGPKTECNDGIDNDGDGKTDYKWHKKFQENIGDLGCTSKEDNDETNCGDGVCEGGETCLSCVADCGVCPTTTIPWTCSDTDGGRVYTVKGTVSGQTTQPFSFTDYCVTGNATNTTLIEYYCRQTGDPAPMSESHICSYSCSDGACV